jgi:anti-anti-sigma factor
MAHVYRKQNVAVVELDAEYDALDQSKFQQTQELLLSTAESVEPPLVAVDLSRTRYMGSGFIEAIFRAWKRSRERQGRLVLCGLQPFCAEVLRTTRLDSLIECFPGIEDAVAALTAPRAAEQPDADQRGTEK